MKLINFRISLIVVVAFALTSCSLFGNSQHVAYSSTDIGCHVNLLTLNANSFAAGQTLTAAGTLVGSTCSAEVVYFWILNPAGTTIFEGNASGTFNSPYSYTINWNVSGFLGSGYKVITSLCPSSVQDVCPSLFAGENSASFSISSFGTLIHAVTIYFEFDGLPVPNVSTVLISPAWGAEVAGGESNASGILIVSLPVGSYSMGYVPSSGDYPAGVSIFPVSSTPEIVIVNLG